MWSEPEFPSFGLFLEITGKIHAVTELAKCRVLAHKIHWCGAKGATKKENKQTKKYQHSPKTISYGVHQANVVLAVTKDKNDPPFVGALPWLGAAAAVLLLYRHFMSDVTVSLTEVIPSTVT